MHYGSDGNSSGERERRVEWSAVKRRHYQPGCDEQADAGLNSRT